MRRCLGLFTGCSSRPAPTERDAFLVRVFLYVVFLAPLALVGLVADYARVSSVAGAATSIGQALRAGVAFVRANAASRLHAVPDHRVWCLPP